MKIHNSIYFCLAIFLFVGCAEDKLEEAVPMMEPEGSSVLTITSDDFAHSQYSTVIHNDMGIYKELAVKPDVQVCISSSRFFPLDEERIEASFTPFQSSTKSADYDASRISINGNYLFAPPTKSDKQSPNFIKNLFGGNVCFDLYGFGTPTKGGDNGSSVDLYAPEIVRISFPSSVVTDDNTLPVCHYKDFVVRWNADPNNNNGVSILTQWTGIVAFGDDYPPTEVLHLATFPDSGEVTLDESMFEDMPDTALCSLIVARGDVMNMNNNDEIYQLVIGTYDVLSFILVRNAK